MIVVRKSLCKGETLQSNRSDAAQDLPILDPNDLLRLLRNFRVMRNNDKRLPALRSAFHQQPHCILARPRIQISGRLVCKNDARFCNQCTGDCHTLLLSAGKLCGAGM